MHLCRVRTRSGDTLLICVLIQSMLFYVQTIKHALHIYVYLGEQRPIFLKQLAHPCQLICPPQDRSRNSVRVLCNAYAGVRVVSAVAACGIILSTDKILEMETRPKYVRTTKQINDTLLLCDTVTTSTRNSDTLRSCRPVSRCPA